MFPISLYKPASLLLELRKPTRFIISTPLQIPPSTFNLCVNGGFPYKNQFDPSAPPPFKLGDIRATIPDHCWVKNPWRSLSYVLRDILVISSLGGIAVFFKSSSWVWPVYWAAQGTMFWALFAIGHDCGHGSFSDNLILNSVVGHIVHTFILIPYHGWRLSHRIHHRYNGHVENDESYVPLTEKAYKTLSALAKLLRYKIPFPLLVFPIYLWTRTAGKTGSQFNPYSDMFAPDEKRYVVTSSLCWALMVAGLIYLSTIIGLNMLFKLYGVPYIIYVMWLDFVVYLHHHGHEEKLPWYRGEEWSYLRGALTTIDRDYGIFNSIHHDIGTHVIHHLFPQIPHYHLVEATKAAKPVLGRYYREPKRSGLIPVHLIYNWVRSMKEDHYVSDVGDIVFYQTDDRKKI